MKKQAILFLVLLTLLGLAGCESRTDRSEGGVVLSVSDFDGLPVQAAVNAQAGAPLQLGQVTIQNIPKDAGAAVSDLMNVEMRSYEIVYTRTDSGTRTPGTLVGSIFGVAPVNGTVDYDNLVILPGDQFNNPPLSDLLFINGGTDTETGFQTIRLNFQIRFFGRTLTGDEVVTAPSRFDVAFVP
ncbi:MAG: hypothetical protein AAF604_12560 [Acidobacteriota bacterium]